jgi:hypothetical protein
MPASASAWGLRASLAVGALALGAGGGSSEDVSPAG